MADDNPQTEIAHSSSPPPDHLPPLFAGAASPSFAVNPAAPSALARLTLTDKLLLAQVVHHLAESPPNWANVSNLVLSHPLIKNPSRIKAASDANLSLARIFGTRECERAWVALMRQHNLVAGDDEQVAADAKQRPKEAKGAQPRTDRKSQLALAQILYAERMEELRDSIKKKEEEFKALIQRIDQLKSNQLDEQLQSELDARDVKAAKPSSPPPATGKNGHARRLSRPQLPDAKEDGDQMDVEDVLGGRADNGKATEQPGGNGTDTQTHGDAGSGEQKGDDVDDADDTASNSQETRRSKRKRTETEAAEDADSNANDASNDTESKRTRARPTPVTRRSRRGTAKEEESEGGDGEGDEEGDADESSAQTPAEDEVDERAPTKPKAATAPRRSLRSRGSTQSRETSVRVDVDPEADDEDNDDAGADPDADTSIATVKETPDADATPARRQSKRELSRRASSSARHNSVESSSTREQKDKERERKRKANEKVLMQIWTEVSSHTHGNLFQNVVKESDAPDYHGLIRHPTSLKTIKSQIKDGDIQTMTQLRRAFNHLFANAMMYNRPTSEVGRMAREMRDATESILDRFEETRNLANSRR